MITFIPFDELKSRLVKILQENGFSEDDALICASVFAESSLDGAYSHGLNRFPRFVRYIREGYVDPAARPTLLNRAGALEQWNGNYGPGPLNALASTQRAMELAHDNGIGMVALSHTNHWMRGGTYGWKAAKSGFIFIGWTNTMPNLPAWGGENAKLGNNPLVMAIPYKEEAIVLDMALSQYSFGKLEDLHHQGGRLETPGGYNREGNLTDNPGDILESWRPLPIGYWKGAALSLLLDMLATILSGGLSTASIGEKPVETGVSQVFIAIDPSRLANFPSIQSTLDLVIADFKQSVPVSADTKFRFPGEKALRIREENLLKGIPVNEKIWKEILSL